jgi:hypothetical protein
MWTGILHRPVVPRGVPISGQCCGDRVSGGVRKSLWGGKYTRPPRLGDREEGFAVRAALLYTLTRDARRYPGSVLTATRRGTTLSPWTGDVGDHQRMSNGPNARKADTPARPLP